MKIHNFGDYQALCRGNTFRVTAILTPHKQNGWGTNVLLYALLSNNPLLMSHLVSVSLLTM